MLPHFDFSIEENAARQVFPSAGGFGLFAAE
jgi:hypothetical protein